MADTADRSWQPVTLGPDVPPPAGAYSPAVRAGELVFVSGQVPRDPVTGELRGGTTEEQVRYTLERMRAVLAAAGAGLEDVVSVTVYLQEIDDWADFNRVYAETFTPPYPSRTVVGAQLGGFRVEISAVARVRPSAAA